MTHFSIVCSWKYVYSFEASVRHGYGVQARNKAFAI